jgi:superfamily II DNA or RNA helicase
MRERRAILERYKKGETKVITNFNILGEGFDSPHTSCIIFSRNTKSAQLVTQALGRGMRLYDGKEHLLAIDIVDKISMCQTTVASSFGLPENFEMQGASALVASKAYESLKKHNPKAAKNVKNFEETLEALKLPKNFDFGDEGIRDTAEKYERLKKSAPEEVMRVRNVEELLLQLAIAMKVMIVEEIDVFSMLKKRRSTIEEALSGYVFA